MEERRIVVVAANHREAVLWCRDHDYNHHDRNQIQIVTPTRPERMRGLHNVLIAHVPGWWRRVSSSEFERRRMAEILEYVGVLIATGSADYWTPDPGHLGRKAS